MSKKLKKITALMLVAALALAFALPAFAENGSETPAPESTPAPEETKEPESTPVVKCSRIVYRLCNHMVYSFDILKASQKKRKRWRWLGRKGLWK